MARLTCAVAALCLGVSGAAHARPVSYQGGWTVIEETDRQSTALWIHHTAIPSLSLGYRGEWDRQTDVAFHGAQATALVKRWFGRDYQGNLYAFAGAGVAEGVGDNRAEAAAAGFIGVLADWETRRWFASYRARAFEASAVDASAAQAVRIGVAPYIGDMGDLHTWLMVEVDHRPDNAEPVAVTPLVRFFKGPALLELGWSVTDDEPLINLTYRF
ncbi:MAG: hypothetical protein MI723_09375 [Caulobacterales bacterium]|nr:hypothetical protein [Caulobacterales bacterium]